MNTIPKDASLDAIGQALEATAARQREAFPEYDSSAEYAAEQHAPDAEDNTEDMG